MDRAIPLYDAWTAPYPYMMFDHALQVLEALVDAAGAAPKLVCTKVNPQSAPLP